ncbi:PREDICTED: uncharacterized protein LOC107067180 [Polistes dominula]|uniref:Transmembrane protein 186 n=1 Tax=Polistes dominula TaxID=743375 RepID=A0ABM1ICJ8_POLDO|nr:PREDICTED: uncharacterized protein LOC107067180 [Polistes dominula]
MLYRVMNQCIRILPYKINHFKINIRFLCEIPTVKEKQTTELNSTIKDEKLQTERYPGYEIIYKYPYIKYVSLFHIFKRTLMINTVATVPIIFLLYQVNILSKEVAFFVPLFASSIALSVFIVGALFTNQIGIIYYKDNDLIKIAYVNQWGKRTDIDTRISEIKPLNSTAFSTMKMFRNVHITSLRYPLKLYVNHSVISNKEQLASILGDYE